jgi:hypothetical protein
VHLLRFVRVLVKVDLHLGHLLQRMIDGYYWTVENRRYDLLVAVFVLVAYNFNWLQCRK